MRASVAIGAVCLVCSSAGFAEKPADGGAASGELQKQLRQIQAELEAAKATLQRSHQKLASMMERPEHSADQIIVWRNDLGAAFQPTELSWTIDGAAPTTRTDLSRVLDLWRGPLTAGQHEIAITLHLRGSGRGSFPALRDYKFVARAAYSFRVSDRNATQITVVAHERTDGPPKDRPRISFDETRSNP